MSRAVPLIRSFSPLPTWSSKEDVDLDGVWSGWGVLERETWGELVDHRRVVILADAGAGKTFEMRAQAERLQGDGRAAFFIRIEDLETDFVNAFEVGSAEAFAAWKAGASEAWFFLDSVDEARLEEPRAFETALRRFADEIHDARHRAHVYVSSRPYAWRSSSDTRLIESLLPVGETETEAKGEIDEDDEDWRPAGKDDQALSVHIYRLRPLDDDDIRIFAGHRATPDTDGLMAEVERAQLGDLARRPFDLEDILAVWHQDRSLASRLVMLQRAIALQLSPPNPKRGLDPDRALEGSRRLAFALTMMGSPNIRLPAAFANDAGFDAEALLLGWTSDDVRTLLSRGVFSDPVYGAVRFRHREVRELLAAEWIGLRLADSRDRAAFEALIFREAYGEALIAPRLRALLPWLILFDPAVRDRALALAPEIVVEGGDASRLPFEVRARTLDDMVERIVRDERDGLTDNAAVARIAQNDLADRTRALIDLHHANDDAIFFLARLAWQGRMASCADPLRAVALEPARGVYARVVSARAVIAAEGEAGRRALWRSLNAAGALPPQLIAELVDEAEGDEEAIDLLAGSLDHLNEQPGEFDTSGLGSAIHAFIDRLSVFQDRAGRQPLAGLLRVFAEALARTPHLDDEDRRVSRAFRWLMDPALHCVLRLVAARAGAAMDGPALTVLLDAPSFDRWGRARGDKAHREALAEAVPRWTALNDALFWCSVERQRAEVEPKGGRTVDEWDVSWQPRFWAFDEKAFSRVVGWMRDQALEDDRLVAVSLAFRLYVLRGRERAERRLLKRQVAGDPVLAAALARRLKPPAAAPRRDWRRTERRYKLRRAERKAREAVHRAFFIARLQGDPEIVRAPPGIAPDQLTHDQYFLLRTVEGDGLRNKRSDGADWRGLVPEFGTAVAEAFRDAAVAKWRAYRPPLASEGADRLSIPYVLIFAMAGLEIDAGEDGSGLTSLSAAEAAHALRYVFWELNGFPRWFQPLYAAHPETGYALIWGEVVSELHRATSEQSAHRLIHDLVYHAPWLHRALAPSLADWALGTPIPNLELLQYVRQILVSGEISRERLAALAQVRAGAPDTPVAQLPQWMGLWVDVDPARGIPALEAHLSTLDRETGQVFMEGFLVGLMGGRRRGGGASTGGLTRVEDLERLYLLAHQHVRVSDDIERAGKGVYSPIERDDAQDAREALFSRLVALPGEGTYRALMRLAETHPEPRYRAFMRQRARQRAVADGDVAAWTGPEARRFINARAEG